MKNILRQPWHSGVLKNTRSQLLEFSISNPRSKKMTMISDLLELQISFFFNDIPEASVFLTIPGRFWQ
jgi:hypothetical protein